METRRDISPLREPEPAPPVEVARLVEVAAWLADEFPDRPVDWFDWVYLWAGCPAQGTSNQDLFEEWLVERYRQRVSSPEGRATTKYQTLRAEWERGA